MMILSTFVLDSSFLYKDVGVVTMEKVLFPGVFGDGCYSLSLV